MSINHNVVRSREDIKKSLLRRAFEGASRYNVAEMKQKITEVEERIKNGPTAAEVLGNVFSRLSGKKEAPTVNEVDKAMGDSESRVLRTYNMMSFLERSENGQYEALQDNKDNIETAPEESKNKNNAKGPLMGFSPVRRYKP